MISLIVATDKNLGIGFDNKIPWKIPAELNFFKKQTIGQNVVLGSNTLLSIGRLLPDRIHHVLTSDPSKFDFIDKRDVNRNVFFYKSYEELMENVDSFFVIGGSSVYKTFLESGCVDRLIISTVWCDACCDSFFPDPFSYGNWILNKILEDNKDFTAIEYLRN